jgi:predicted phosphodiesterase
MDYKGIPLIKGDHGTVTLDTDKPLTVLAIPDIHAPFHHQHALSFLKGLKKEFKPDVVVCLGDEVDFAALSFHDRDPDMPGARHELESALEFMGDLYKLFPDVLVCQSNHTARPFRVAHKAGLPTNMVRGYKEFLQAPEGWNWFERIIINSVCYIHGDPKSGNNAARQWAFENRMSTVIGHVHGWAQVGYTASPFNQIFWVNSGALIDPAAMAFRYGSKYANKATLGATIIRNGRDAFFIPMR